MDQSRETALVLFDIMRMGVAANFLVVHPSTSLQIFPEVPFRTRNGNKYKVVRNPTKP